LRIREGRRVPFFKQEECGKKTDTIIRESRPPRSGTGRRGKFRHNRTREEGEVEKAASSETPKILEVHELARSDIN